MTTSNSTSTAAKTANIAGAPGAFDLYGPVSTIPQAISLPLSSAGDKYQTTIYVSTHLGLPAFVIQNGAFIADHTVYLGRAQASTHQLTPTIADRPTANGTLSGTGTGVGNKIFIKSLDGRKTQLTVVKADGSWQADLTASGFLATDDLYVIETNDLGDLPGAAVQPRYATVTRVVNGVNAVTKEDLGTLTTQTQSLVQRAKVTAIDANQLQNPDGIKDGSAITVDWQPFTNLDGSPASFSAISMATIANPDAAHLIAQTADLPSIAAAAGKTVTQTAVYYPKIITVSGQHTSNPSDPLTQGFAPIEAGNHLLATDNLSPVLAGGLGAADLYQVIHQTIHYVDAKTQTTVAPDHHTNLPLYREVTVNLEQYLANPATGLTYSDWKRVDIPSSTTFDAVTSPVVPGWCPLCRVTQLSAFRLIKVNKSPQLVTTPLKSLCPPNSHKLPVPR
ncbi:mucin-binding protein [Secundilactobacillus similis]|uniref:mucin-binding protein n=1 Tax=Secundilactobacillus similis TaxID=414682 RepID=UPI0012E1403F|nr:hypothetical protein [Secundilactobacillus similis]